MVLRNKEYIYLAKSSITCCFFQYCILSGSHKIGGDNWPYVFPTSLITFLISNYLYKKNQEKNIIVVIFILMGMTLVPFLVYTLMELLYFPMSLLNTINRNAAFYFCSVTLLSGGWIFSMFLILNSKYRKKLYKLNG